MPKRVYVTPAQTDAARLIIERAEARGRPVDPNIVKIANAKQATPQPRCAEAATTAPNVAAQPGPVVGDGPDRTSTRSGLRQRVLRKLQRRRREA